MGLSQSSTLDCNFRATFMNKFRKSIRKELVENVVI